ncbi:MAG: Trk system potassium transporter TrkA [Clostridiales bacterium]|nr:Trk system potassium transporter TrkA [Clostridiales bacterium]
MKILIAGGGKVGDTLTRQLSAEGHDLTLIDCNASVLEAAMDKYDVMAIQGNCAVKDVLIEAGVDDADLLIAVTATDELNLLCCMTAHGINKNLHTIARIRNPEYRKQFYEMRDTFALSMTVNPEGQAAEEIARLIQYPGFLKLDTFAKGRVEIVELRVLSDSKLVGAKLSNMYSIVKSKILVCAVLRDGEVIMPDGNFELRVDDRVFVTASKSNLSDLLENLGIISRKVKRVLICGGGKVSFYLAGRLEKAGVSVKIIEKDPARCEELAQQLENTTIVLGDISSRTLLESEGISNYDAVVSLTGMDEVNIITSLYAHISGVRHVITKMGRVDNSSFLGSLPIGSVVCPKELCCNNIVRYVRAMGNQTGAAIAVHFIADGMAEAVEFVADESVKNCGVPLKDLKLKPNILVSCITRGGKTEIPDGNSSFNVGDTVVVVTNSNNSVYKLDDIFE